MSLRIVFAGTPAFAETILQCLIDTKHEVVAVYTQPDRKKGRGQKLMPSPVKNLANQYDIPVYQPVRLKDPLEHERLKALQPHIMVVVAYGLILPAAVLTIPTYGCINVHASHLPRWRGAAPIQRSILANDLETGICIMQMDAGLDTGDVLNTSLTPIHPTDTSATLHQRLATLGAEALLKTLEQVKQHTLHPVPQDHANVSYATKITKEEAQLDWSCDALTLNCKIRAFNPWPVASAIIHDLPVRIFAAEPIMHLTDITMPQPLPGTIIASGPTGILVMAAHNTALNILELQLPGGKPLKVREILNAKGTLFKVGDCFQ